MNISDYLRTALLNHALNIASYTPPAVIWAALYTGAPNSGGGGTEVGAADYKRVSTAWTAALLGTTSNSLDIRFPVSGVSLSSWGLITAMGLFDSSSAGHLLFFGGLSAPVTSSLGDDFKVSAGGLTISFD